MIITIHCLGFQDALNTASAVYVESNGKREGIPAQVNGEWIVRVQEVGS
jgi:hypothetical protein